MTICLLGAAYGTDAQAAATATYTGNELTIISDGAGDLVTVTCGGASGISVLGATNSGVAPGCAALQTLHFEGNDGNDRLSVSTTLPGLTSATLNGGIGLDTISDVDGPTTIDGGSGDDEIRDFSTGADSLIGGSGADMLTHAAGDVLGISISLTTSSVSDGAVTTSHGGFERVSLVGRTGPDTISSFLATGLPVTIDGNLGSDRITTGLAPTSVEGGSGDFDTMTVALISAGSMTVGAASVDRGTNDVDFSGLELISLLGGNGADTIDATSSPVFVDVFGSGGADSITGSGSSDLLKGETGQDTINGGGGNDIITGGLDGDSVNGQAGPFDRLEEVVGATATVTGSAFSGSGGTATFSQIERLDLSSDAPATAIDLSASSISAGVTGTTGADAVTGAGSSGVEFQGGGGDDSYVRIATTNLSMDLDTSIAFGAFSDTLGSVEHVTLRGTNAANQLSVGKDVTTPVVLEGLDGGDLLTAQGLTPVTMNAGNGDDRVAGVVPTGGTGRLTATEVIVGGVAHPFTGAERGRLTAATGAQGTLLDASAFPFFAELQGSNGPDTLRAGASSDILGGGNGIDTVVDSGGGNYDAGAFAMFTGSRGADTVGGIEAYDLTGGPTDDRMVLEGVTGVLHGGGGRDTLTSDTEPATLDGGAGDDTFTFGSGAATLLATGSAFTFAGGVLTGEGSDTLGTGADLIDLVGTSGDDSFDVTGAPAPVRVDGRDGSDAIALTSADAVLKPGSLTGGGVGATLGNVERAVLTGTAGSDVLNASAFGGAATLLGLDGADTLTGGSGPDVLDGGGATDVLTSGEGADDVRARDGTPDLVDCGDATDVLTADLAEGGALNCETVLTPPAPVAPAPVVPAPVVTSPGVTPPVAGRALKVELVRAKFDAKGRLILTVRCPAASTAACADTLKVQGRSGRKTVTLASKRYTVRAGKQTALTITLARTQVRKAARKGRLAFTVVPAAGVKGKAFSLRLPRKR